MCEQEHECGWDKVYACEWVWGLECERDSIDIDRHTLRGNICLLTTTYMYTYIPKSCVETRDLVEESIAMTHVNRQHYVLTCTYVYTFSRVRRTYMYIQNWPTNWHNCARAHTHIHLGATWQFCQHEKMQLGIPNLWNEWVNVTTTTLQSKTQCSRTQRMIGLP